MLPGVEPGDACTAQFSKTVRPGHEGFPHARTGTPRKATAQYRDPAEECRAIYPAFPKGREIGSAGGLDPSASLAGGAEAHEAALADLEHAALEIGRRQLEHVGGDGLAVELDRAP